MAWIGDAPAATTLTYQYDANGNMISGEGKHYEYNDANQLVRVRQNNAIGPVIAEYFYDYNGQRIKKFENGITTYYIGKHYETEMAGGNKANTSYYFANGERVARKDPAGKMFYFHSDHLGSSSTVTDATGTLVARTKYYPFGELREGGNEKYLYTGKEQDKQTDWYYYEARYYNPQLKHFTQVDTVFPNYYDPQSLNRYEYVKNNPIKLIDPTGNKEKSFQIASPEWNSELIKARQKDRPKYELMKKQYMNWSSSGGPQLAADAAYWNEYAKQTKWLHTSAFLVKQSADVGVTVLGNATGPMGKSIKGGYDSFSLFIENYDLMVKFANGNISNKEAISRASNLGIKLIGNKLSDSIGSYDAINALQKGIGEAIVDKSIVAPVSWATENLFGE
jgi:RHS repeat-associated protein